MKTLLRNALIVTMNENNDVIEHGAIGRNGKLVFTACSEHLAEGSPGDTQIEIVF